MEKDLNKSEKKITDEDDDDFPDTKNASRKSKKSELDDKDKKPSKLSSFFVVGSDGETTVTKKNEELENHESEDESKENLSEDEVHEVIQIIIDEREQSVASELAASSEGSPEELEAVAAGLYLESLRHKALSDDEITPESIEQAYEESLEDLDIPIDSEEDLGTDEIDDSTTSSLLVIDNYGSTTLPTPPISTARITPSSPVPTTPLIPTTVPGGPTNLPPNTLNGQPNQQRSNQNRSNRNIVPIPIPIPLDSGAALLAGSITGYIVGRSSKSNKNVTSTGLFDNKKLENQVKQLQATIYEKESLLRAEVKKLNEKTTITSDKPIYIAERRKKRIELREELKRREELVNNPKVEKIGNFSLPALKIYRERRLPDGSENHPKRKPVEIMTVKELLEKSGHVKYEKWRIDELYKAHRITEKVLRQVTKEYMRGGPYKQTLAREVLPDPKIIAEKYKQVESAHNNSETAKNIAMSSVDKSTESKSTLSNRDESVDKNVKNMKTHSRNSLPLPWVAMVTAISTIIALALIYLL